MCEKPGGAGRVEPAAGDWKRQRSRREPARVGSERSLDRLGARSPPRRQRRRPERMRVAAEPVAKDRIILRQEDAEAASGQALVSGSLACTQVPASGRGSTVQVRRALPLARASRSARPRCERVKKCPCRQSGPRSPASGSFPARTAWSERMPARRAPNPRGVVRSDPSKEWLRFRRACDRIPAV
jgi:hypothetical protein